MKVILLEKINKTGNAGEVINIKNGYARNYILPKKIGLEATTKNIEKIKNKVLIESNNEKKLELNTNTKLNNLNIIIPVSVKKNEEIYGFFNPVRLAKIMKKLEIKLDVKNIESIFSIRKTGNYKIIFKNKKINIDTEIYITLLKAK